MNAHRLKHFLLQPCVVLLGVVLLLGSNTYAADTAASLTYLVRPPHQASTHPPLIILLHGVGSNEHDLFSFAEKLPAEYLVISVRAPYALGNDQYAWYHISFNGDTPVYDFSETEKSRKTLIQFITRISAIYSVDQHAVYLLGFSQGAVMSYGLALTRPDLVSGVALMSGRLLAEVKPLTAPKELVRRVKFFISHGTNDQRIAIQQARDAVEYLKSLGVQPAYKEYKATHEINAEMLADVVRWLKR